MAMTLAQHGWADRAGSIRQLVGTASPAQTAVVAPDLGWWRTWWRLPPLVDAVEAQAAACLAREPQRPVRIVGHSMGGLLWLELLARHPEWWPRVRSLVLLASPVGGAALARAIDPLGVGLGMAKDLGVNRRAIAERIAAAIPTLVVAGNWRYGSDGTILLRATRLRQAQFVSLALPHPQLRSHPALVPVLQRFWARTEPQLA